MKQTINKFIKFTSLGLIMDKYPEAFDGKPEILAAKATFTERNGQISQLINSLIRPISTVYRPKQASEQKLRAEIRRMSNIGITIASRRDNKPLVDLMKVYRSQSLRVSAFRLPEIARHLNQELSALHDIETEFGIKPADIAQLNELASAFTATFSNTGFQLINRKSEHQELKSLMSECTNILKLQLDPYIVFNAEENNDLYREYMLARSSRSTRKPKVDKEDELSDISGTVSEAATGLPVANANINLIEHGFVIQTDADGYYLLDELPVGDYTVSCHAYGYQVPASVSAKTTSGESLVIDFELTPETTPVAKPSE